MLACSLVGTGAVGGVCAGSVHGDAGGVAVGPHVVLVGTGVELVCAFVLVGGGGICAGAGGGVGVDPFIPVAVAKHMKAVVGKTAMVAMCWAMLVVGGGAGGGGVVAALVLTHSFLLL